MQRLINQSYVISVLLCRHLAHFTHLNTNCTQTIDVCEISPTFFGGNKSSRENSNKENVIKQQNRKTQFTHSNLGVFNL